ncbi:RxLR-like protein [Plasmopara halstedii]|uniref:glucan endo-1,3-beta-D-glucosidase n=1 Tax=Plasmopara halstedii TaxID=4781 RepID=A0A0N7L686_PLAHL|nr:RxLR-like protein [Plasmopara halstedii]CEG43579.1 RxLR-like protein [Plasmopara halstedii]|eukprot:XP_024579948.1 RxLR-like protein [Plasmopara halstedii]
MAPLSIAPIVLLLSSASALSQKLYGINYDLRQGPDWDPNKCKDADTIASDLKILSNLTSNVRTYSLSDCDVTGVLTAAKDLSLTVWLGVWVSEDPKVFKAEVEAFKKLVAAGHIDSNIVGMNVGSETVYRGDISATQAIEYINDFKKVMAEHDISIPVSITDIVDTFIQYPDMLKAGDIVTINQFPYWEKIKADKAVAHFDKRIKPLLKLAGDMEVVISETGWPTGGSSINGSVASEENGAIYLNDFCQLAESRGWKYYYFAGFDTPYKEKQEDDPATVESHFGLFDASGTLKAVYENIEFTKNEKSLDVSSSASTDPSGSFGDSFGTGTVSESSTSDTSSSIESSSQVDTSPSPDAENGSSQLTAASFATILAVMYAIL